VCRWHIETSVCASPCTALSLSSFSSIYHSLEVLCSHFWQTRRWDHPPALCSQPKFSPIATLSCGTRPSSEMSIELEGVSYGFIALRNKKVNFEV
jgi:hypothetical protein